MTPSFWTTHGALQNVRIRLLSRTQKAIFMPSSRMLAAVRYVLMQKWHVVSIRWESINTESSDIPQFETMQKTQSSTWREGIKNLSWCTSRRRHTRPGRSQSTGGSSVVILMPQRSSFIAVWHFEYNNDTLCIYNIHRRLVSSRCHSWLGVAS